MAIGVLVTRMPRAAQAATSTVSKPTPLRAKIFTRQSSRAMLSGVTRGRLTWIASYRAATSGVISVISSGIHSHSMSGLRSNSSNASGVKAGSPLAFSRSRVDPTLKLMRLSYASCTVCNSDFTPCISSAWSGPTASMLKP